MLTEPSPILFVDEEVKKGAGRLSVDPREADCGREVQEAEGGLAASNGFEDSGLTHDSMDS